MNLTTLQEFRQEISSSIEQGGDALFNTVDALLSESQAQSFPELSLSPFFVRGWSSLYKAFKRGSINGRTLQDIFIKYIPESSGEKRLILGIDATSIERPFSPTSPDRTAMPLHNIPRSSGTKQSTPITFGWKYSTVTVLPEDPSSWTYMVDQQRIPSSKTDIQVALEQLKEIVPKLKKRPLVLLDRGYVCVWLWCQLSGMALDALGRLKGNQCFYQPAPEHTGKRGAPRKDGAKLKLDDPGTQSHPDESYDVRDKKGHAVSIRCWKHMHVKTARWLDLTIIQVIRPHAKDLERDPRISWFVYIGPDPQEGIAQIALMYGLRFSQEHGYRFKKQALLWTEPHLQTPQQFDLWTYIVSIVHNHVVLARDFIEAELRPWENKQRQHSPQQVRRGLAKLVSLLGTPARPPKPRGKSKGRSAGVKLPKRTRFPVVRKKPSLPQMVSTSFRSLPRRKVFSLPQNFFCRSGRAVCPNVNVSVTSSTWNGAPPGCAANQATKSRMVLRYVATVLGSRAPRASRNCCKTAGSSFTIRCLSFPNFSLKRFSDEILPPTLAFSLLSPTKLSVRRRGT